MIGLKENVLIGKLIPAGTGMKRYSRVRLDTDEKLEAQNAENELEDLELEISEEPEEINQEEITLTEE